ncbi:MDR family MFS transporter [Enterococcus sp. LJL120]
MSSELNLDIHGKSYRRGIILALILFATFSGVLMQTSLGTALPTLMQDFDINLSTAQQATTWFLLANGMMVPLSAYLATKMSTKWLHFISYGILMAGLILTAVTPAEKNMWVMFIAGRVLAAIAVGIMLPLMQIVILNMFKKSERSVAMGLSGLVVGMAPAIGPTLSGWILDRDHTILGLTISSSWRTIFVVPLIVIVIAFILTPFVMKDIIPNKKIKLDILSLILSVVGFGLFLWGFTNVAGDGWTDFTNVLLPIGVGLLVIIIFGLRQLKLDEPFLNIRVFKNRDFTIPSIAIILVTMAMFGVEMMLPTYLQNVHGDSTLSSGLTLLPGALMMGIMSPIAGVLYNRVGIRSLALVGFSVLLLGTVPFVFITETTPTALIVVLYAIRMFGIALTMMPLTTSAMSAIPLDEVTHGTAANNTVRQISSSVVVALLTSVTQNIINTNTPAASLQTENPLAYGSKIIAASMDGFRASFAIGLSFAVAGVLFALFLHNKPGKITKEAN